MIMMSSHFCVILLIITCVYCSTAQKYIFADKSLAFADADAYCSFNYGTSLASIHNQVDNEEAKSLCSNNTLNSFCWIGLTNSNNMSNWTWSWSDGTAPDYGISTNNSVPWVPHNNYTHYHCVTLQDVDKKWINIDCDATYPYILCNHPTYLDLINDDIHNIRIPQRGHIIGTMPILDEIIISFNFVLYSCPDNHSNILHIGNNMTETYPIINIDSTMRLQVLFSRINNTDTVSYAININESNYLQLHASQNSLLLKANNAIIYNESDLASHSILMNRTIFLSNPFYDTPAGFVSNLKIQTSNAYEEAFNYLCDYNNRFTNTEGDFKPSSFTESTCVVFANGPASSFAWLGHADPSSVYWTDYTVEAIINFPTGDAVIDVAGIIPRSQTPSRSLSTYRVLLIMQNSQNDRIEFQRREGDVVNVSTTLYSYNNGIGFGRDYKLRIKATSNVYDIYLDDKFIFTVQDSTYLFGSVGLYNNLVKTKYKSLRITFPIPNDYHLYSIAPTTSPTFNPSFNPTFDPTFDPTFYPTFNPSFYPTFQPTFHPTFQPTFNPTYMPTFNPSVHPTFQPTFSPQKSILTPTHNDGVVIHLSSTQTFKIIGAGGKDSPNTIILIIVSLCILVCVLCLIIVLILIWVKHKLKKNGIDNKQATEVAVHVTDFQKQPGYGNIVGIELKKVASLSSVTNDELFTASSPMPTAPTNNGDDGDVIKYVNNNITIGSKVMVPDDEDDDVLKYVNENVTAGAKVMGEDDGVIDFVYASAMDSEVTAEGDVNMHGANIVTNDITKDDNVTIGE